MVPYWAFLQSQWVHIKRHQHLQVEGKKKENKGFEQIGLKKSVLKRWRPA